MIKRFLLAAAMVAGMQIKCEIAEGELPSLPMPEKGLPVQDEPIAPIYKENPYSEDVPVPDFTQQELRTGMMIFRRPLTEPIYPQSRPKPWERIESLNTFGARGQIVSLNFAVYPQRALEKLRVTTDFPLPDGQIRQIAYWKVRYPYYTTKDTYRIVPTYLFPATWCNAPALEPQQYVINMRVPADAKPGVASGILKVSHAGYGKALEIPYTIRIMDYSLKRDPRKNFSAYFAPVRFNGNAVYRAHKDDEKWLHKASVMDYKLMVDYGFTRPPSFNLGYKKEDGGKFYVDNLDKHLAEMKEAGLPTPVFLLCGSFTNSLYHEFTKKNMGKHLSMPVPVPEEMYVKIDKLARAFLKEWNERKLPPIIIGPVDEPSAASLNYVRRLYKIFKDAGYRTFMTSCPFQADVNDVVDFWSDQPFRSFKEVQEAAKKEYWCYPNHNAYEIKDVATMTRGGRMTYGYGLWKSDYNFLMPWIWRYYFNEHLLTTRTGGGGHLLTDDGQIIIEYDWENFKEGEIDGRYIYSLQQAIVERTPAKDPELQALLVQGRMLLQNIWDSVPAMNKYLASGHWTDREFEARRAEIALMLARISAFPKTNDKVAPSIIVNTEKDTRLSDFNAFLKQESRRDNLDVRELSPADFMACEDEAKLSVLEDKTMVLKIDVDHNTDGTGSKGQYKCGWPRIRGQFSKNPLNFNKYGYLAFKMKLESNRDGEKAISWPMCMEIANSKHGSARGMDLPPRQEPGAWKDFVYQTSFLLDTFGIPKDKGDGVDIFQVFIREGAYQHGDKLEMSFKDFRLFGVKQALIKELSVSPSLQSFPVAGSFFRKLFFIKSKPTTETTAIPWSISILGELADSDKVVCTLSSETGKQVSAQELPAKSIVSGALVVPHDLACGKYTISAKIISEGKCTSSIEKTVNVFALD